MLFLPQTLRLNKLHKNKKVNLLLELCFRAAAVADQYEVIHCHSKTNFAGRPYVN